MAAHGVEVVGGDGGGGGSWGAARPRTAQPAQLRGSGGTAPGPAGGGRRGISGRRLCAGPCITGANAIGDGAIQLVEVVGAIWRP
jgi:hypothetical protein